jgi:hypothetical protein
MTEYYENQFKITNSEMRNNKCLQIGYDVSKNFILTLEFLLAFLAGFSLIKRSMDGINVSITLKASAIYFMVHLLLIGLTISTFIEMEVIGVRFELLSHHLPSDINKFAVIPSLHHPKTACPFS